MNFTGNDKLTNGIFIISVLNILGFLFMRNYEAVMSFLIFGFMAAYFSQDLKIILGVPLIVVNFIYIVRHRGIFEGMENKNSPNAAGSQSAEKMNAEKKNAKTTDTVVPEPNSSEEPFGNNGKKKPFRIDYATSVTNQYKELNNILGSANIQQLTKDSKDLLDQQQQLTKAMEGMAPLVEKLVPMMESMGGFMNGTGVPGAGVQNLANVMKQMGNKTKK